MTPTFRRLAKTSASFLALIFFAGCVSLTSRSSNRVNQQIARADAAYRSLNRENLFGYNESIAALARQMDGKTPNELRSQLAAVGVTLDQPQIKLPLARYHTVPRLRLANDSNEAGIPILLDYDTSQAPLYPPEDW